MADAVITITKSFSLIIIDHLDASAPGEEARIAADLRAYHADPTAARHLTASTSLNALSQSRLFRLKREMGADAGAKSPDIETS